MTKMKNIFLILMITLIASCAGESGGTCYPDNGTPSKTIEGDTSNQGAKIDKWLKENKIISTVVDKLRKKLIGDDLDFGVSRDMFTNIVDSAQYQGAVSAAFTLFIIIYGLGIATGVIQHQLHDAAIRLGKIGIITVLAMNWAYFYNIVGITFIAGTDELIKVMIDAFKSSYEFEGSASTGDEDLIFADLDNFTAIIFSNHMFAVISALFSPNGEDGPYSTLYAIFLIISVWYLLQAILKVVQIYIFSLFAKALLFSIAPIFLVFLLFQQTKNMFDAWLKQLINYSLQPLLVSIFLGLFLGLIYPFLAEVMNMTVCTDGDTPGAKGTTWKFYDKPRSEGGTPVTFGQNSKPAMELQALLMFYFFSWLFGTYIKLAEKLSSGITVVIAGNLGDIAVAGSITRGGGGGGGIGSALKGAVSR